MAAAVLVALSPAAAAVPAWTNATTEPVLTGLDGPTDVAVAGDGTIWWNSYYSGNVTRYDPRDGTRTVVFHADPIPNGVERGLVGLALDPEVTENGVFYVYYTVADPDDPDGGTNRLSRVDDGREDVLLTVPAFKIHNGGRILFAPDGTMFVSTGDNGEGRPAQDPGSRLGKILHLHPDGRPANDTVQGYVYSLGHRNVYGLAYDESGGRLFATENSNAERDEVNLIEAGANYGWPLCEGTVRYDAERGRATDEPCNEPGLRLPIGEFYPNGTAAPTGAVYLDGALYWASWNHGEVHRMTNDTPGRAWNDTVVYQAPGRINDLEAGPDGEALYIANWTGIHRLNLPGASTDANEVPGKPPGNASTPGPGAGTGPGSTTPAPGGAIVLAAVLAAAGAARLAAARERRR